MALPMLAVGLGLAGVSIAGKVAANKAEKRQVQMNRDAIMASLRLSEQDIAARRIEEREASNQAVRQTRLAAMEATGRTALTAAEGGVAGLSVSLLQQAIAMQQGGDVTTLGANLDMIDQQLTRQLRGVRAEAQSRMNTQQMPSGTGLALGIAGSLLNAAGSLSFGKPAGPVQLTKAQQANLWVTRNQPVLPQTAIDTRLPSLSLGGRP